MSMWGCTTLRTNRTVVAYHITAMHQDVLPENSDGPPLLWIGSFLQLSMSPNPHSSCTCLSWNLLNGLLSTEWLAGKYMSEKSWKKMYIDVCISWYFYVYSISYTKQLVFSQRTSYTQQLILSQRTVSLQEVFLRNLPLQTGSMSRFWLFVFQWV